MRGSTRCGDLLAHRDGAPQLSALYADFPLSPPPRRGILPLQPPPFTHRTRTMVRIDKGLLMLDYGSPRSRKAALAALYVLLEDASGIEAESLTEMRDALAGGEHLFLEVNLRGPPPPKLDLAAVLAKRRDAAAKVAAALPKTPARPVAATKERVVVPSASPARARYEAKRSKDYNANDLYYVIYDAWVKKWPSSHPSSFTMADRANAKRLIDDYGPEVVAHVILKCIDKWEVVQKRFGVRGHPSMAVLFGFRSSLFPFIMDDLSDQAKPSAAGSQHNAKNSRPKGSEEGWD